MNISWFLENVEMAFHSWAHILQRAGHFISTQNADNLTKTKTEQKWVFQTPLQIFLKGLPVANICFNGGILIRLFFGLVLGR